MTLVTFSDIATHHQLIYETLFAQTFHRCMKVLAHACTSCMHGYITLIMVIKQSTCSISRGKIYLDFYVHLDTLRKTRTSFNWWATSPWPLFIEIHLYPKERGQIWNNWGRIAWSQMHHECIILHHFFLYPPTLFPPELNIYQGQSRWLKKIKMSIL